MVWKGQLVRLHITAVVVLPDSAAVQHYNTIQLIIRLPPVGLKYNYIEFDCCFTLFIHWIFVNCIYLSRFHLKLLSIPLHCRHCRKIPILHHTWLRLMCLGDCTPKETGGLYKTHVQRTSDLIQLFIVLTTYAPQRPCAIFHTLLWNTIGTIPEIWLYNRFSTFVNRRTYGDHNSMSLSRGYLSYTGYQFYNLSVLYVISWQTSFNLLPSLLVFVYTQPPVCTPYSTNMFL